MRFDKLTAKFQQALAEAQSLALAADSSYLEAGFVLKALLDDQNSGAAALLAHAGVNVPQVKQRLQQHLNSLPKVSGRLSKWFIHKRMLSWIWMNLQNPKSPQSDLSMK